MLPGALETAPAFEATLDQLRQAVLAAAQADPGTRLEKEQAAGACLRFRARSRLLGLPDLISVRLIALADGRVSLAIFSRARYGLYDLGVNRRRVRRWLRRIEARLCA